MTQALSSKDALTGIFYVTLGFFLFSVFDMLIKLLSADYSVFELMFFGGLGGTITLVVLGSFMEGKKAFKTTNLRLHVLRGCLLIGVNGLNLFALRHIQLVELYAVAFLSPLLITMLCALFLKDAVGPRRWSAILIGFIAVLYMLRPGGDLFNIGGLAVFCSVFLFSINMLIIRKMGRGESKFVNALAGNVAITLFSILWLRGSLVMPHGVNIPLLALLGICNGLGSKFLQLGFQISPSSAIVAPFHYSQLIWGALFGYVFFGDIPAPSVVAGAGVLILTGLYIIRVERRAPLSA